MAHVTSTPISGTPDLVAELMRSAVLTLSEGRPHWEQQQQQTFGTVGVAAHPPVIETWEAQSSGRSVTQIRS